MPATNGRFVTTGAPQVCRAKRGLLFFVTGIGEFSRSHHAAEQQPYAKYQNGEFTKKAEGQSHRFITSAADTQLACPPPVVWTAGTPAWGARRK